MSANTSARLSGNGYDSATEDSISMYYSFNATDNDKTLENIELDSTVEIAIDDALNTVIKAPQTTPIKGKLSKILQLDCGSSSTPSDKLNSSKVKHSEVFVVDCTFDNRKINPEIKNILEINENPIRKYEVLETSNIAAGQNDSQGEKITIDGDNSVVILEGCSISDKLAVLKDASSRIWQKDNQMNNLSNIGEVNKGIGNNDIYEEIVKAKDLEAQHSLADKMVDEIRCLLQGTKVNDMGKENIKDEKTVKNTDEETRNKSPTKKQSNLKRPSRISLSAARRSILQADAQLPSKTVTPVTRIIQSSRNTGSNLASSIPTPRDTSTSSSYSSLKPNSTETIHSTNTRRSLLTRQRMSMVREPKSSLVSIPENGNRNEKDKTLRHKRFSVLNIKPKAETIKSAFKVRAIPKTTLNSPVMVRRELLRKSLNKFTSNASNGLSSIKIDAVTKQSSITANIKSAGSLANNTHSSNKLLQIPSKTQISCEDFVCEVCSRSFRVSSIFEAHKKTHNPSVTKETNTCKFCDKSFAISKALDKHLLENCLKIPLSERKKVKIAASQLIEETAKRGGTLSRISSGVRSERMCVSTAVGKTRMSMAGNIMPPPSTTKVKRTPMAHSGISKTPNKTVRCKPCERNFDNVLSFAEHVLSHSNSSLGDE